MSASTLAGLPLFFGDQADEVPAPTEADDIAHLEAIARDNPVANFANYQDEPEMKWNFDLRNAARIIYGKSREIKGQIPAHIDEHIRIAGERGSQAMSAAQYREDTDAQLHDRINGWEAELRRPLRKPSRKTKASDEDLDEGDDDLNRRTLAEWLSIAIAERARRAGTPHVDHLADMEQRAREKFGVEGLDLINLYVAQTMAFNAQALDEQYVLVNGKELPDAYEAMASLRQGDPGAAQRFIDVLALARETQQAGYPNGITISFASRENTTPWTEQAAKAFAASFDGGIFINGVAVNLDDYRWSHHPFPIAYAETPERTAQWWSRQFADALEQAHGSPAAQELEAMVGARIREPILVVWQNRSWHVIDGKRRVASRFYCHLNRVPAIWGVPRNALEQAAAQQEQLFARGGETDGESDDYDVD